MKKIGVRIVVLGVAVLPSVALLSRAGAGATPNNTGTNRASTHARSSVVVDPTWTDASLIDNGGRRLG